VTKAFLDVDYRDMDPRIAKVLTLSTGTFKNQYETAKVDLKTQAQQAKAVATGAVRYVGLGDLDDDTAVVYVAADTKVSNSSIEEQKSAGKTVDDRRYYRFQLSLKKVGSHWLLNDLQFIS
jgi:Mce-associated membrane protein